MGVNIDEAGRGDQIGAVDLLDASSFGPADHGDGTTPDRDIADKRFTAAPVENAGTANDDIEVGGES